MGFLMDRIKNGNETVKNPLGDNRFSYGEIVVDEGLCNLCGLCQKECLTGAITMSGSRINIEHKKCLFCRDCIEICPTEALSMTDNYRLSTIENMGDSLRESVYSRFNRSLTLRAIDTGSCNGCSLELASAQNTYYNLSRYGINIAASPRHSDGLIVSGAVSINMKSALIKAYQAVSEPKIVIALGGCSYDGGIFKNSYSVSGNLNDLIPVDVFIPGCPPSPQAIIEGILRIMHS